MTEKFGVDGAFRNSAAVHGKIFFSFAKTVVVNDAGKDFFADTVLSGDQDGQIHGRNFEGNLDGTVQRLAITHNVVALLDLKN